MKVDAEWLHDPAVQDVTEMLEAGGHRALFVGGCVRNALLGAPVSDLDLATDARPDRVMTLASAAGLRAVPTGFDHGTVTVLAQGKPFEVTTFRRDIKTDGRHAVVTFADTVREDAERRDFTMNALYCDRRGQIEDPLGGLPDLQARYWRFVGTAQDRVREDYLRILRFFRFHAWYGDPDRGLDPDALDACARHADGLDRISRERIGAETLKLLTAPDPAPAVAAMDATGILTRILPGADNAALALMVDFEGRLGLRPDPIARLALLIATDVTDRLRLSRIQGKRHAKLRQMARDGALGPAAMGHLLGAEDGVQAALIQSALMETPPNPSLLAEISRGAEAVFPVSAEDLMPEYRGAALGRRLTALKNAWLDSGVSATKDDLLSHTP